MEKPKTKKKEPNNNNGLKSGAVGRKTYQYKPVCKSCTTLADAETSRQGLARERLTSHKEKNISHTCYLHRISKSTIDSGRKNVEIGHELSPLFRPFCNDCDKLRYEDYTNEETALDKIEAHLKKYKSHSGGVEEKD